METITNGQVKEKIDELETLKQAERDANVADFTAEYQSLLKRMKEAGLSFQILALSPRGGSVPVEDMLPDGWQSGVRII